QMAAVNILVGNRPEVFIMRVLVNALADLLPAHLVVELAHLLLNVRLHVRQPPCVRVHPMCGVHPPGSGMPAQTLPVLREKAPDPAARLPSLSRNAAGATGRGRDIRRKSGKHSSRPAQPAPAGGDNGLVQPAPVLTG